MKPGGPLFAGTLGVKVYKNDFFLYLRHVALGNDEGIVRIAVQREAAHEVQKCCGLTFHPGIPPSDVATTEGSISKR